MQKSTKTRKLTLNKTTLRLLVDKQLNQVAGGKLSSVWEACLCSSSIYEDRDCNAR
jgi:hypothetical protein